MFVPLNVPPYHAPMFRRWLIRSLFMLPILLCMAGWVWGATHFTYLTYHNDGRWIAFSPSYGAIMVDGVGGKRASGMFCGWRGENIPISAHFWGQTKSENPDYTAFLGFRFSLRDAYGGSGPHFSIPYWFLIVAFSIILLLAWRKTRPALNPKSAFPVDIRVGQDGLKGPDIK